MPNHRAIIAAAGLGLLVVPLNISAAAAGQTNAAQMAGGATSTGAMVTTSTSGSDGVFNPDLDIGPTGGSTTTSGFCIPGGLGCGPDSDLTPIGTPVPEPSAIVVVLLGFMAIASGSIRRRRKRV